MQRAGSACRVGWHAENVFGGMEGRIGPKLLRFIANFGPIGVRWNRVYFAFVCGIWDNGKMILLSFVGVMFFSVAVTLTILFISSALSRMAEKRRIESLLRQQGLGKTVVITGAASGIGKEAAMLFGGNQWKVFALDVDSEGLNALKEISRECSLDITTLLVDLTDAKAREDVAAKIQMQVDTIDALVNNAGSLLHSPMLGTDLKQMQKQFEINVFAPIHITSMLINSMLRTQMRGAAVINVSSIAGIFGYPWHGAYSTTKFALEGFTNTLRIEAKEARLQLRVCSIKPGPVKTPMMLSNTEKMNSWANENPEFPFVTGIRRSIRNHLRGGLTDNSNESVFVSPKEVAETIYAAAVDTSSKNEYFVVRTRYFIFTTLTKYLSSKLVDELICRSW